MQRATKFSLSSMMALKQHWAKFAMLEGKFTENGSCYSNVKKSM